MSISIFLVINQVIIKYPLLGSVEILNNDQNSESRTKS